MAGFLQKFVAGAAAKQSEISIAQIQEEVEARRQKNREAFEGGQRDKDRAQMQSQHEDKMAASAKEADYRNKIGEDKMAMAREAHSKSLESIDQQIESGKIDLEKKKAAEVAREEYLNTDPADIDAMSQAMNKLASYGIKFPKKATKLYTLEDPIEGDTLVSYDQDTGLASEVDVRRAGESAPARRPGVPKIGDVQDGYRFVGGDPANPENWTKQ